MTETNENSTSGWFTPLRQGILLALLIFAAFPQVLLGLETFVVRDYGFFVYPLAHFQQECFRHGQLPFWDPYNNCGVPFLAQWNTMSLYPPTLIYLSLPLGWSLSFFSLLHLWFAGMGMFFLARKWTGNSFAAAFAGTAFAFNGFTLNLLMWPSHLATLSWMPWVILAIEPAWREGRRKLILAAFAGAMQMLAGGPEIILLTWLIASALWLQQWIIGDTRRLTMLWRFLSVILLVIALTVIQLLPFLDLVAHAQRGTGFADMRWSMPGSGWANFLLPMAFGGSGSEGLFFQHGQYWTSSYYLGLGTLWLALLAVVAAKGLLPVKSRIWLLAGIAIVGLLLALGENTPLLPALRKVVPQLSFITYPVKYVCLTIFAVPLLAAFALANYPKAQKRLIPLGLILIALLTGILFWTQFAPMVGDDSHATLMNGFSRLLILIVTGAILFALTRESGTKIIRLMPIILLLAAWVDVYTHEPPQNPTVATWIYETDMTQKQLALNPQPALGNSRAMVSPAAAYRFISFALSSPKNNFLAKRLGYCANCNLLDRVPKADGFFSLTPMESDEIQSLFYTTTNASYPRLEDFMGVSQITAADEVFHWQARTNFLPLITAGQKPVFDDDTNVLAQITRNDFDGRNVVYLPKSAASMVSATNPATASVENLQMGNTTMDATVNADGPTIVVIAQTYYHNWAAQVDGHPAPLLRANVGFQAVPVTGGKHQIHLQYHDGAFETGAWISGLTWLCCLAGLFIWRQRTQPA